MKKSIKDTMTLPQKQTLPASIPAEPTPVGKPVYATEKRSVSRLTLDIPLELSKELKITAIHQGTTMKELVLKLLKHGLDLQ